MEPSPAPTILSLKQSFLRTQIQALSAPLSVPSSYRPASAEVALKEKAIDAALERLNEAIRKHAKMVYGGLAQRHVAEQIDRLYWMAGDREGGNGGVIGEEGWRERGADLGTERNIETLPNAWDGEDGDEDRTAQYQEAVERLKELNERRKGMREKVRLYKALQELLEPFENATESVQGNLVTRDGELERELERMRLLVARVRGRIEGLPEGERVEEEDGFEMDVDIDFPDKMKEVDALF